MFWTRIAGGADDWQLQQRFWGYFSLPKGLKLAKFSRSLFAANSISVLLSLNIDKMIFLPNDQCQFLCLAAFTTPFKIYACTAISQTNFQIGGHCMFLGAHQQHISWTLIQEWLLLACCCFLAIWDLHLRSCRTVLWGASPQILRERVIASWLRQLLWSCAEWRGPCH